MAVRRDRLVSGQDGWADVGRSEMPTYVFFPDKDRLEFLAPVTHLGRADCCLRVYCLFEKTVPMMALLS